MLSLLGLVAALDIGFSVVRTHFEAIKLFVGPVRPRIEGKLQDFRTLIVTRGVDPDFDGSHVRKVDLSLYYLLFSSGMRSSDE